MVVDILEQALALVTPADLTQFARQIPDPQLYVLNRFAPEVRIPGIRYRVTNETRTINAAKFRVYDAGTPVGRRQATRTVLDGILPPVGIQTMVGELETLLQEMARGADASALIDFIYNDAANNALSIRARMELARGDLLNDGKFTLNGENGLYLDADYGLASNHKPTAAVLWSDTVNATPIDDEQAWQQQVTTDLGGTLNQVVTSLKVYRYLLRNQQYRSVFYAQSGATSLPNLTPGQMQQVRDQYGLPPITTYEAYVSVDGTQQRVLPDNKWITFVSEGLAETQYGSTAEATLMSSGGNPQIAANEAPGIVVTRKFNDDPPQIWVRANAVAMPVLFHKENLISATVSA